MNAGPGAVPGAVKIELGDPRYCQRPVRHDPHTYRYQYTRASGEFTTGRYECDGAAWPVISDQMARQAYGAFWAARRDGARPYETMRAALAEVHSDLAAEVLAAAAAAVERLYAAPPGRCACPDDQRNCGYRAAVGAAADAVRQLLTNGGER